MHKRSKSFKQKHVKVSPDQAFDVCDYFNEDDIHVQLTGKFAIKMKVIFYHELSKRYLFFDTICLD